MIEMHQLQKAFLAHSTSNVSPAFIATSHSISLELQQSECHLPSTTEHPNKPCNNSSEAKTHSLRRFSQNLTLMRQSIDTNYGLYGSLLGLERDKIVDEGKEEKKIRIFTELQRKNSGNARAIRRFSRKASLRKQPLLSLPPAPPSQPIRQQSNSFRGLSRGRQGKETNILECLGHYSRMQERVDGALKDLRRDERRTSILKSIVMNASDMFSERRLPCPLAPPINRCVRPRDRGVMGKTFAPIKA